MIFQTIACIKDKWEISVNFENYEYMNILFYSRL